MTYLNSTGTIPPSRPFEFTSVLKSNSDPNGRPVVQEKSPPLADSELKKVIGQSNAALKQISSSLEFSQEKSTGKTLIRVYDRDTKELIRQFPSEEMIAIAKQIDSLKGALINQTV